MPTPTTHLARRRQGLSVIEALCSLAVTATALGSALPSLHELRSQHVLAASASEVETDLHLARSEALARGQSVRLVARALPGGGSCYVIHTGPANACDCNGSGTPQCTAQGTALRLAEHTDLRRPVLATSGQTLTFDARLGTVTPTATLRVVDGRGRELRQVINLMGRVRTCSTTGRLPGVPAC